MNKPTRWFGAAVVAGAIALAIAIPRAVEAQRRATEAKAQPPPVVVGDKGTERRLEVIERNLEMLLKGMKTEGTDKEVTSRLEAKAGAEKDRLVERRLVDLEQRLSDVERKLRSLVREWERTKRR